MYCLECCDAAAIPIPSNLRQTSASDTPNDRAEWLAAKAAEKRAKLDAFLASRKAEAAPAPVIKTGTVAEAFDHIASPVHRTLTATPTSAEQLRLI